MIKVKCGYTALYNTSFIMITNTDYLLMIPVTLSTAFNEV